MYDTMAHPDSPAGFANSKSAYSFVSRKNRDSFVAYRQWDESCRAITAKEARWFRKELYDPSADGCYRFDVPPYDRDGPHTNYMGVNGRFLLLKEKCDGVKNMPIKRKVRA